MPNLIGRMTNRLLDKFSFLGADSWVSGWCVVHQKHPKHEPNYPTCTYTHKPTCNAALFFLNYCISSHVVHCSFYSSISLIKQIWATKLATIKMTYRTHRKRTAIHQQNRTHTIGPKSAMRSQYHTGRLKSNKNSLALPPQEPEEHVITCGLSLQTNDHARDTSHTMYLHMQTLPACFARRAGPIY